MIVFRARKKETNTSTSTGTVPVNIKLTIEYDGTNYHGWQVQPNGETIQGVLEQALEKILRARIRLNGSGRTDAGVHALGQVANFIHMGDLDLWRLQKGLNALTPEAIVVKQAEPVADSFDARRDGRSRVYQYRIWTHPWPSAFHRRFSWHVHEPLDPSAIQEAIRFLEGEHDFASFQAAGCDASHPVRTIYRNSLRQEGEFLLYTIEANAFLRHMVRNIVGTLIEVGRRERTPEAFGDLLLARDRTRAGPTAPPHGLFLMEVRY
ncbi:MAG: tRNA pseudouridine(38-40) synthase TruA [Deltaproteobacteria bacterium]|nr:tRNA pseudouridine(38-40) synthase TruA [Deltaproteobacteria bacterium]